MAAARQSSSRAGTLPCGLWPRASFWVLVSRARICFHGGLMPSRSRRRTPSRCSASASARVGSTRRSTRRSGVDEGRIALHAGRALEGLGHAFVGEGGQTGALDAGPGATHLPPQLRRRRVAHGLEVLARRDRLARPAHRR